ncbi:hypothetical protein SBA2_280037 [Acidobacteriia bacterium SbA2]|nr:hypothetical protein SBA2_280037 [Acidobacteriia bacterium SbA2]
MPRTAGVLSQKFVKKIFLVRSGFSKPRQGRKRVVQGASPGSEGPHSSFGTPLPLMRERGGGEGVARAIRRLTDYPLLPVG